MQHKQVIEEIMVKSYMKGDELIFNLDIKVDEFIEKLIVIQNTDGFAHITIEKKNKLLYWAIVNTYIPRRLRPYENKK